MTAPIYEPTPGQVDEVFQAAADAAELFRIEGEGSAEQYDRIAELFYRETGWMAPGKDDPAGAPETLTHEERAEAFIEWRRDRVVRLREALEASRADSCS